MNSDTAEDAAFILTTAALIPLTIAGIAGTASIVEMLQPHIGKNGAIALVALVISTVLFSLAYLVYRHGGDAVNA